MEAVDGLLFVVMDTNRHQQAEKRAGHAAGQKKRMRGGGKNVEDRKS